MKQKPIKEIEKYSNQWVAIDESKSKIVAAGKDLKEVYKKVVGKKVSFMAVPPLEPYFPWMKTYKFYYTPVLQRDKKGNDIYAPKPLINLAINYKKNEPLAIWFLVDSGADYNLFPGYLGDLLNINVKKGEKRLASGIGGIQIESFFHEGIGIFVEGHKIETNGYFSYKQQIPLLGQNGFFDKCSKVLFNRREEEIIITI